MCKAFWCVGDRLYAVILRLKLRVYGGIASAVWYRQPIEPFPKSQSDFLISVYKNGQNDVYSVGALG